MLSSFYSKILFFLFLMAWNTKTSAQWVDLDTLESGILLDIRYAGKANFVGEQMYPCGKCLLRPEVMKSLQAVHQELSKVGLYLKVFDCYRPGEIQKKLWEKVPNAAYVAPPSKGSNHNRGMAVDIGLVNSCGEELDMGSEFDHLGRKSHHDHLDHSVDVLARRKMLKEAMEAEGFSSIRTEWWHYNYYKVDYPLSYFIWECDE